MWPSQNIWTLTVCALNKMSIPLNKLITLVRNTFWQTPHCSGYSALWIFKCRRSVRISLKPFSHCEHWNTRSSVWTWKKKMIFFELLSLYFPDKWRTLWQLCAAMISWVQRWVELVATRYMKVKRMEIIF